MQSDSVVECLGGSSSGHASEAGDDITTGMSGGAVALETGSDPVSRSRGLPDGVPPAGAPLGWAPLRGGIRSTGSSVGPGRMRREPRLFVAVARRPLEVPVAPTSIGRVIYTQPGLHRIGYSTARAARAEQAPGKYEEPFVPPSRCCDIGTESVNAFDGHDNPGQE